MAGTETLAAKRFAPAGLLRWRRPLGLAAAAGMAALAVTALLLVAPDAVQGPPQRIFYIHVPSAWVGFLALAVVFVASVRYLVTGDPRHDDLASASAGLGVLFTTGVLLTGPLWARPVWGAYWVWDPRLTSFFVLWLVYLSYLALRRQVTDPVRRARYSAVLGVLGFLDVPIVYMSVNWWRGMHPEQVVITADGPGMPAAMLATLLLGLATFTLFYLYLLAIRLGVARARRLAWAVDAAAADMEGTR